MSWSFDVLVWLVHAALGGFVVLAAGCLAVRLCRQPVRRLRLIELTLLGCLLVPWMSRLEWLPHWSAGRLTMQPPAVESPTVPPEMPVIPVNACKGVIPDSRTLLGNDQQEAVVSLPAPSTAAAPEPTVSATSMPPEPALPSGLLTPPVIVIAYGVVVAGMFAWWLAGVVRLVLLYRTTYPVPQLVSELFQKIVGPTDYDGVKGLRSPFRFAWLVKHGWGGENSAQRVRLVASDRIDLPLTFTGLRPVIVLPGALCSRGDSAALRYCLAHEWSHVEGRDTWRWYLATLSQLFFFYQPLFWWLRRQLRLCQDYLADARAAEQAAEAEDYAEYLVGLARRRLDAPLTAALGIGDRRSNLYRRIFMLLQNHEPLERRCLALWNLAATLGAIFLLVAVAAVRLDAGTTADDKKDAPPKETPKEIVKDDAKKPEALHYTCKVIDKDTGKPIAEASVTVRRSLYGDPEVKEHDKIVEESKHKTDAEGVYKFTIPPEQVAKRYLYIELDVEAPDHAPQKNFGYALSMILKNEKMGGRPFFENVQLRPAKEITGVIQSPDGRPAAGIKVLAYSVTSNKKEGEFEYGSFADTRSDDKGKFSLMVTTPGTAVFWILPEKNYAPSIYAVKDSKRGDLGVFGLKNGISLRGKVLDAKSNPVSGVNVNADAAAQSEELQGLPVADSIRRSAVTNDKGEFEMAPLPPGDYRVKPDEHASDGSLDRKDRKLRPVPGVFSVQKVTLKEGVQLDPIEVRAVPHVTIEAQYYDSKGKTTRGHECFVFGRIDNLPWFGKGNVDASGKITALIPHGLEQVQLDLMTNEHGVLRWRKGKDDPLKNTRRMDLGTVSDDVKGIELIRYTAPILIVKVVAKDGTKLKDAAVTAMYPEGKGQYEGRLIQRNGRHSDVSFEHQEDGRFRSSQLLPDEEVTIQGHADGYEAKPVKLKFPEGETKEIEIVMEKAAEKKDVKEEKKP